MNNRTSHTGIQRAGLRPLSDVLDDFNQDKNPLERLNIVDIDALIARKPPSRNKKIEHDLQVKRTDTHPRTGQTRLPYRLAEVGQRIVDAVQIGATYKLAAKYAGVNLQQFYIWIKRAEQIILRIERDRISDSEPMVDEADMVYLEFYMRLQEAEGKAAYSWLQAINDAATVENKWQAAAWLLERRHPEDYGKKSAVHQHHTSVKEVTVEEWQKKRKSRILEANSVVEEFAAIEDEMPIDVDHRHIGREAEPLRSDAVGGSPVNANGEGET